MTTQELAPTHENRMRSAPCLRYPLLFQKWAVCIWLTVTTLGGVGSQALAQRNLRGMPFQADGMLMPAPREVKVLIEEAKSHIESEQWTEATLALGVLLGLESQEDEDLKGVDYFLENAERPKDPQKSRAGTSESVFRKAFELMESLPVEATKFVDLRYGVLASQLLEQAVVDSDWNTMERVAGRYPFTTAGQDACVILGEHWLRKGNPRLASRFLLTAFRQKSALSRLGAELGILTASTLAAAGLETQAIACLDQMRMQIGKASIDWKGTKVAWDDRANPAISSKELLLALVAFPKGADQATAFEKVIKQPWYLGGNPTRNADTNAGSPLPILRWHTELHESKQHKENLAKTLKEKQQDSKLTFIPSRYPISVGPWIITSTYDQRIVAVDSKTGRLGWECLYSGMPLGFSMEQFASRDSNSLNASTPDYLIKRVWGESVVGMPTSDGKRVFSISELPAIDVAESFALGQNARVSKPQGVRGFNVLQCWSVAEEGKILWEVGGAKSPTDASLAGVLFLGAPLPMSGELFAVGELNSDVYLFSISPLTGKVNWRQPLASNSQAISGDQLRRNVGATPAADGSILICPTLSGHLIAFDTVSHSLLWTFEYPLRSMVGNMAQFGQFGQTDLGDFNALAGRSADPSVTIHDGIVFFAPPEGQGIYAISIVDGRRLWDSNESASKKEEKALDEPILNRFKEVRYIAGVWNGLAIIACQSQLIAVDTQKFKIAWSMDLPLNSQLAGRGVRKGGMYFLPTTDQDILQVDLQKGTVVEKVHVEQPLGNIVVVGDRLISASPFQLDCYAIREAFQSELKEELQRSSVSRLSLTRQAELAFAKQDFEQALQFLEKAKSLEPTNAEVLILLNKVGIAALTYDFDKYVDRVTLSKDLAFDRERMPYLKLVAQGLQLKGRNLEALEKLLEMSDLRIAQRQDQSGGNDMFAQSSVASIQQDRWIATNIQRCFEKLSEAERAVWSKQLATRLIDLQRAPTNIRRMKLDHLAGIADSQKVRVTTAFELIQQRDLLGAERILNFEGGAEQPPAQPDNKLDSKTATLKNELLAEIYVRVQRYETALAFLNGDTDRLKTMVEDLIDYSQQINDLDFKSLGPDRSKKVASDWPKGPIEVNASRRILNMAIRPNALEAMTRCQWNKRIGTALLDWSVSYGPGNWLFEAPDGSSQIQLYVDPGVQEKGNVPTIYSVDSLAIVEMNRQIFAVNTLQAANSEQDGLLWRESFDSPTPENERGRGRSSFVERNSWGLPSQRKAMQIVSVSRTGVIVAFEDMLMCLDLQTGAKLWNTRGVKDCSFASDDDSVYVFQPSLQSLLRLDLRDGTTLNETKVDIQGGKNIAAIGKHILFSNGNGKQNLLRLLNAASGKVVFEKSFASDTRLAFDGESSLIALTGTRESADGTGELTFWNFAKETENRFKVQVEGAFGWINVQKFGDTLLVLPFAISQSLDSIAVWPDPSDPLFAPVAGRIIAISANDGSAVWKQNNFAKMFFLPIAQDRNSPIAFFVRRLTLSKIAGVNPDLFSLAIVDVRDGQVLYTKDDLPAIRNLGFSQTIDPGKNQININFLGTSVDVSWPATKQTGTVGEKSETSRFDFGEVDYRPFRQEIEEKILKLQAIDSDTKDDAELDSPADPKQE